MKEVVQGHRDQELSPGSPRCQQLAHLPGLRGRKGAVKCLVGGWHPERLMAGGAGMKMTAIWGVPR